MTQICICIFLMVAMSDAFFLQGKDLRKVLNFFKSTDAGHHDEASQKHRSSRNKENYFSRYPEEIFGHLNRDLNGDFATRYSDHHAECKHPSHFLEDRNRNQYEGGEDVHDYFEDRHRYPLSGKRNSQKPKQMEDDEESVQKKIHDGRVLSGHERDYVSGVLLTIPKVKNAEELEAYFKESKRNRFLANLLARTNNDQQPDTSEDIIQAYIA